MGMVGLDPFQLSVIQAANVDDCKTPKEKECETAPPPLLTPDGWS